MRITEENIPHFSIVWFGVDISGNIISFFSLGDGNIPGFVKDSEEETMELFHYWYGHPEWDFSTAFDFRNTLDKQVLLDKGLYICSCDDPYDGSYRRTHLPKTPTRIKDLPPRIKVLLQEHSLPFHIEQTERIMVEH